jgi:HEAT repeat protein
MVRLGRVLGGTLVVAGAIAAALPLAAMAKPPAPPAAGAALPAGIDKQLASGDPAQIKGALDEVRLAGKAAASHAHAIAELLRSGLDASLTLAAIDTLGDIESEQGSEALAWYARHRKAELRRAAVAALAKTKGAAASRALRQALADPDAKVRGAAAIGLGAMRAKDAVPDLFVALDHKVHEAAASIGQLCGGPDCEKLADKLGQLPFDVVTSGLDPVLFRPAADINDDTKIKIIGRLRELGTFEANRFLRDVAKKWPDAWSKRVKQSIDQAVLATSGSVGGTPSGGAQ